MSPAHIRTITLPSGAKRYVVRFRRGGRAFPLEHGGTFKTMRDARRRQEFISGELAAGRNPRESLLLALARRDPTPLASFYATWKASRIDVDERTRSNYEGHWHRIEPTFGKRDPHSLTHTEIQDWLNELALTPKTVRQTLGTLAMVLDFAEVEPNPARHRLLRLPRAERKVPVPPTDKHVLAILEHLPREKRLLFAFLEQTGARLGEALSWEWGDVDLDANRILSRPETVKGRRGTRSARWVQIPEWLLALLYERVPPDDRSGYLFRWPHGVRHPRQSVHALMQRACQAAGIPHFHPHDLRHRRISLWHGQGIPARDIGDRVGQRQVAVTLDTYSHVMPLDEISREKFEAVLT